ncbi:MAG: acyl-CoA synthetase FdrA [Spartobacteria bacterium]|nr:acyl-CoA synthetase FdrA [Spartobacteria bacterium]
MSVIGRIRQGIYFDSVTLMNMGRELSGMEGVVDAAIVMGTHENKAILQAAGLLIDLFADTSDSDLLIGVKLDDPSKEEQILEAVDVLLSKRKEVSEGDNTFLPQSLDGALTVLPDANLVLISIAGRYAAFEAQKALDQGRHVMMFSDNVSIEDEVALKIVAREKGLLVMGPDCGTAIINGVPLAFANVVRRGKIGIVAASGTGLQEVSCLIHNAGAGISQAIGTGGRDVKKQVGGIMFIEGLKALLDDAETETVLLVSKPPDADVLAAVNAIVASSSKPVVSMFLGASGAGDNNPQSLEEAALMSVALAQKKSLDDVRSELKQRDEVLLAQAEELRNKCTGKQQYIRGLFSGGTFCTEAQLILEDMVKGDMYANAPAGRVQSLEDAMHSVAHTFVDLGEDEFTVGRPHPMIDYTLRNKRIADEADDAETAVILLDIVLGYGSNMNLVEELKDVITDAARKVVVVCSVTGTDMDPQNRGAVISMLRKSGAVVLPSNAAACLLAGYVVSGLSV